ncbi:transposase [Modestobacter sp. VKM Ac-2984]|uniref:transposase n=1 Tax=Modestobacter sp. VKM Ac-2984 TaxID=3004138 RepID=UPI003FA547F2
MSARSFAALCGVSPLPTSSGRTHRHGLNRGGDRQANAAIHRVTLCGMRWDPRTRAYVQRRTEEGLSKTAHDPQPQATDRQRALLPTPSSPAASAAYRCIGAPCRTLPGMPGSGVQSRRSSCPKTRLLPAKVLTVRGRDGQICRPGGPGATGGSMRFDAVPCSVLFQLSAGCPALLRVDESAHA